MRAKASKELKGAAVLSGHLLPYVVPASKLRRVVVLRCDPSILKRRLEERKYGEAKVVQNVQAELIGVVSAESFDRFGAKASEYDTSTTSPEEAAKDIARVFKGRRPAMGRIDWTDAYDTAAKLGSLFSEGSL